ncbi:endonuclease/exonuclease/phosphatase family protein [Paraurantiacibacter namhicola]|uniref:Endonuclease/Exonuclease/phosphatase family protein n=1 Tax=Paraurantiacibacter namhicola TaxID=645517 RepID=A0A1C7D582_9SPHN|nr:endonuclease/exonuclease/phosphatase family protein [Paraurantiacibacter namhicola]ANU06618.1 Endonuclease/Exonuclease/phosphatase family protein [Paraurantiacibacter namhicola]
MRLRIASYNIHKAVGTDRVRDPERILTVLGELDADIIALQEVDRRFGRRISVLPRQAVEEHGWHVARLRTRPASMGWHGNAVLVRRHIAIDRTEAIALPRLEPRGAVCAHLSVGGSALRVVATHLDLSGIRRRHQVASIADHILGEGGPAVVLGDCNEWTPGSQMLRPFPEGWQLADPGRSFPSRRPVAKLDRILVSPEMRLLDSGVHHSPLSARASDHLPVWADLDLPEI